MALAADRRDGLVRFSNFPETNGLRALDPQDATDMLTPKSAKTLVAFLVARKSVTMLWLSRTTGAGKWVDSSAALWRGGHSADGLMCKVCHWDDFMDADEEGTSGRVM